MTKLNVFVSSTCYDLSQVRTDLYESLSDSGFTPILSEFPNFPINPSSNTVENCIDVINKSADIFVLLIGNRYGFKLESGKSITNMEYLAARNKGIPIYVFISKQLIHLLPVYLNNKTSDYSSVVDNPGIFEFTNEVRNSSGLWSFEFEKVRDITTILKTQLSYLFKESLTLRNKFYAHPDQDFYDRLSSKALKIIFTKDNLYEYEFLAQVWVDEISKYEMLKKDYEYKIILKSNKRIAEREEFLQWIMDRANRITTFIPSVMHLVNVLVPKYMNEPGTPADLKGFYYIANTYARAYETFIDWTIETLSFTVKDKKQKELQQILSEYTANAIKTMWEFPFAFQKNIVDAKEKVRAGATGLTIKMDLVLEVDKDIIDRYNKAIRWF
jgi:hypothetical protein